MSNDLQHHGIKGMRWGVRRFQNSDGSLTPAGRKRYSDYDGGKDSAVRKTIPVGGGKRKSSSVEDYQNAIKRTKSVGEGIDNVRKFNDDVKRIKDPAMEKRIRKSTEQMSDKDLQQRVQRLNMEDNYTRMMMHREHLKQGEDYVNRALDISAVAVRGATTALTIALLVKQLRG
jgi:predicted transcriptional regulator